MAKKNVKTVKDNKIKKEGNVKINSNIIELTMSSMIILLILALFFFNKGGYFRNENIVTNCVLFTFTLIYVICMLCKMLNEKKKNNTISFNILDISVISMLIVNILPIFTAASVGDTIMGINKYLSFVLLYFIGKKVFKDHKYVSIILNIFMGLCIITVLLGIDQFGFKFAEKIGINYTESNKERLSSFFQYANVAALFISLGIFVTKYLKEKTKNRYIRTIYSAAEYVEIMGLLMTQSRMCIALFVVTSIIYSFMHKEKHLRNADYMSNICKITYAMIFYIVIYNFIKIDAIYDIVIFFALSIIPVVVMSYSFNKMVPYFEKELSDKKVVIIFTSLMCIMCITLALGVFVVDKSNQVVSVDLKNKVNEVFKSSESLKLRFTYIKDAFLVFKKSPIIGSGNRAFEQLYQGVQTKKYISSEVHSYPMDLLVNNGILGFAAYAFMVYLVYSNLIKQYKKNKEQKYVLIIMMFSMIVIHSILDLDLTYMMILACLALIISAVDFDANKEFSCNLKTTYIFSILILVIATYNAYLMLAASIIEKGTIKDYASFVDAKKDINKYEIIIKLVPNDYKYRETIANKYDQYVKLLTNKLAGGTVAEKLEAKKEFNRIIPLLKDDVIKLYEQNKHNKYAVQTASVVYFKNFVNMALVSGKENYKEELDYSVVLAKKIIDLGPINDNNYIFAYNTLSSMRKTLNNISSTSLKNDLRESVIEIDEYIKTIPSLIEKNHSKYNAEVGEELTKLSEKIKCNI